MLTEDFNSSSLVTSYPGKRHSGGHLSSSLNQVQQKDVVDLVDDLLALRFLIDDLCSSDSKEVREHSPINLWETRLGVKRLFDLVERMARWGDSDATGALAEEIRRECLQYKEDLRIAYRYRGAMLCSKDWQSPAYESSTSLGRSRNRLMEGIREHVLDYKRDGHLEAIAYEKTFLNQYAQHLGSSRLKAYLANSGMAAFSTVLHWLAHEAGVGAVALALTPMYFENIHLAKAFYPHLIDMKPNSSGELLQVLRAKSPSCVFLDAVTNSGEVITQNYETVLDWARREAQNPVFVVIDTTCMPIPLLSEDLLAGSEKNNMSVILVESLAKHHQHGLDIVTGGIVVADLDEQLHSSFAKTRARFGGNISDTSVGSLPAPDGDLFVRRMKRHSRNMEMLADRLESMIKPSGGALASVSWVRGDAGQPDWFRSPVLSLRLHPALSSVEKYQEFEAQVLKEAESRGLSVSFGTSFGFDITRMYVTAPSTPFEKPFLRLSVGTETWSQVEALADAIERVVSKLDGEVAQSPAEVPSEVIDFTPGRTMGEIIVGPGRAGSAYIGEDALAEYLCPENYSPAPLVELPSDLNPYRADGVRMFAKLMPLVPLMNIKSIPAFSMLKKAQERGELEGVKNVIESSSSNTVMSLSIIARLFGIENTYALVDHSIAPGLLRMLRLFGIEPALHPGPGHELYDKMPPRSERAYESGACDGWINPGQYANPDNPDGFSRWLAPDLWAQSRGQLEILSCGLGTCGTMVGVSRVLRSHNPDLKVVACCPRSGEAVPGPREKAQLSDVEFDWTEVADYRPEMSSIESFEASVKLIRRGIMGGPSSGMNYAGLLEYLQIEKEEGRLESLVAKRGELWTAFLCCDSPLQHVDEYFDALGEDFFPAVKPIPDPAQFDSSSGGI